LPIVVLIPRYIKNVGQYAGIRRKKERPKLIENHVTKHIGDVGQYALSCKARQTKMIISVFKPDSIELRDQN
jgi:hypothetical protein